MNPSSREIPSQIPGRGFWLKQVQQWHWISSALALAGMLLFTITGFTLNHAGSIEAHPQVVDKEAVLPASLLTPLQSVAADKPVLLPVSVTAWLKDELGADSTGKPVEWHDDEVYVGLPRPGGDAWLSIQLADGAVEYERTDRGWIAWFNDLHKGRNTGAWWGWFIDLFALAGMVFCLTGFLLLYLHAPRRPLTWVVTGLGLLLPVLLALLFIH